MDKVRVIQVGAGNFGRSWINVVLNYEHTELVGVVDVMKDNLSQVKESTSLPDEALFTNPSEAFEKLQADVALIVTPPQTHKELTVQAIKAGLHVIMEKPLTHTYEEAVELLELSRGYNKEIMISQNYRWRPAIQTVKKLLKDEVIGRTGYIEYAFRKGLKFGGWRDQYKQILLEDMSIHHFDILRYLLDKEPEEVYAQSYRPSWSWFSGNPTANLMIRFQDQIQVSYFGSWVSRGKETTWNGDIRIVGDKGAIELIDDQITLYVNNEDREIEKREVALLEMPYEDRTASLNDMISAIREQRKPLTSIEDNIKSFELTCMSIHSAVTGEKVKTKDYSRIL